MKRTFTAIAVSAVFALSLAAGIAASATPAHATSTPASVSCGAGKRRAVINRLRAINVCFSKAPKNNVPPPDPACIARADESLQRKFQRLEAKGGCLPAADDSLFASRAADDFESQLLRGLSGVCLDAGAQCGDFNAPPCCTGRCGGGIIGQPATCR